MTFAYRRPGASFLIPSSATLPANIDINLGGVAMEVADVGTFGTVTTGAETVPVTAPSNTQQVFRYRFLTTEATTLTDQTATGLNASNQEGTVPYTASGQVDGAYGAYFFGLSVSGDRSHYLVPNNAKFGNTRTRFIMGLRPVPFGDLTQTYGTIIRAQNADQSHIWSLVRGTDNTLLFGIGNEANGLDTSNCLQVKGFFTDNTVCTLELEIDGQDVRIWRDNVLVSDDYTLPSVISWSSALIRVGNQSTSGGGPFWGHMSHLAAYTGDLTDGEVRWIRDTAKTLMETAPKILSVSTPPAARPVGQLTVTRSPSFSVKLYSLQGTGINFRSGRASDNLGGPIASSFTLTLNGSDVKPARGFTLVPGATGNLVLTDTFDNAIHPAQSASVTLPILVAYPQLTAAQIKTRMGNVGDIYIDNFDAGFPEDATWKPSMIVDPGDSTIGLRLLPNNGAGRPNLGGSAQFLFLDDLGSGSPGTIARLYNIDCQMHLTDTRGAGLAKGYVQTMFTFQSPYTDARREHDFEFNPQTGWMECAFHLAPNDAPGTSVARSLSIVPPAAAFTGLRNWSITSNADRIEWWYEGTVCARYIRGSGFDNTVQTFSPKKLNIALNTYSDFTVSDTLVHPNDAGWHLNAQNGFIQQWMSNNKTGWIGPNTVPLTHPLLKVGPTTAQAFGPNNTALQVGDWTATPLGGGQIRVNVSNYRPTRFRPTHLEYSIGGGAWTRLAGTTGNQTISGVATGSRQVRLRPVAESINAYSPSSFTMNANASDTKTVTVT